MKVKHLVCYPSGDLEWVDLDRERRYDQLFGGDFVYNLDQIRGILGCEWIETVQLMIPDVVILIDECGKISFPEQQHNSLASKLYNGYLYGDDIVGPAIFFGLDGPNIRPLSRVEEAKLSLALGVLLPEK